MEPCAGADDNFSLSHSQLEVPRPRILKILRITGIDFSELIPAENRFRRGVDFREVISSEEAVTLPTF